MVLMFLGKMEVVCISEFIAQCSMINLFRIYGAYNDLMVYMIYQGKPKTSKFSSLNLLTFGSFQLNGYENSNYLSETCKRVSVCKFTVIMMYNYQCIHFDFSLRMFCSSY